MAGASESVEDSGICGPGERVLSVLRKAVLNDALLRLAAYLSINGVVSMPSRAFVGGLRYVDVVAVPDAPQGPMWRLRPPGCFTPRSICDGLIVSVFKIRM